MEPRALVLDRRQAQLLGWTPRSFGATDFDASLLEQIRQFQQSTQDLEVDGVAGPLTYRRLLDREFHEALPRLRELTGDARIARAGELAVNRARSLWLADIVDPPRGAAGHDASRTAIDGFIRGPDGLGWSWEKPYQGDGQFEWCGAFCATAWGLTGLALASRKTFFSSTYRLDRWGQYLPFDDRVSNPRPADLPRRHLDLDESSGPRSVSFSADGMDAADDPRPGDILLVGGSRSDYGSHITLVESYDAVAGVFTTLEGNGTGPGPRGNRHHGVVRTTRRVGLGPGDAATTYHARRLIRPSVHDLA